MIATQLKRAVRAKARLIVIALLSALLDTAAFDKDGNYASYCHGADDTIHASNGMWYYWEYGDNGVKWSQGGAYITVSTGVSKIQESDGTWVKEPYFHRSLWGKASLGYR